jgi:hypothetical protein
MKHAPLLLAFLLVGCAQHFLSVTPTSHEYHDWAGGQVPVEIDISASVDNNSSRSVRATTTYLAGTGQGHDTLVIGSGENPIRLEKSDGAKVLRLSGTIRSQSGSYEIRFADSPVDLSKVTPGNPLTISGDYDLKPATPNAGGKVWVEISAD